MFIITGKLWIELSTIRTTLSCILHTIINMYTQLTGTYKYYPAHHTHQPTKYTQQNTLLILTIIHTPPTACAVERSPSEMFMVTDWPTSEVSVDRRLISSPVLVLSKKATSCFIIEPKSFSRIRLITLWPDGRKVSYYYGLIVYVKCHTSKNIVVHWGPLR